MSDRIETYRFTDRAGPGADAEWARLWLKLTPEQRYQGYLFYSLCGEVFIHEADDGSVRVLNVEEVSRLRPPNDGDRPAAAALSERRHNLLARDLQRQMFSCAITECCLRQYLWGHCSLESALLAATLELGKVNQKLSEIVAKAPRSQTIYCSAEQYEAFKDALNRAAPKADADIPAPVIAPASRPAGAPPSS